MLEQHKSKNTINTVEKHNSGNSDKWRCELCERINAMPAFKCYSNIVLKDFIRLL